MDATRFIGRLRARLRTVLVLEGTARLAVILVAVVAAVVVIDWRLGLPGWFRLAALVALLAVAAAVAWKRLIRPLARPMDDRSLAELAERRAGDLGGRLVTAVEGIDLGAAEGGALAGRLGDGLVAVVVPARKLPRVLVSAALALGLALGCAVLFPGTLKSGLARLFAPLGDTEYERLTVLSATVQSPVVAADEKVVLEIRRVRGPVAPVLLAWSGSGGDESRQLPDLAGPWRQGLSLPVGRTVITVTSGDAAPVRVTAVVIERPRLAKVAAVVTPPAYARKAGAQVQTVDTLALSALAGSEISFTCTCSTDPAHPLATAAASVSAPGQAGEAESLALSREGNQVRGRFVLRRSGEFRFSAEDANGIKIASAERVGAERADAGKDRVRFALTVVEDRKPLVEISGPLNGEAVTSQAVVGLRVAASDDLGLAKLDLRALVQEARHADAEPEAKPTAKPEATPKPAAKEPAVLRAFAVDGQPSTSWPAEAEIGKLAKLGETVVLTGRAEDGNDVTGPGVGESAPVALRVVGDEEVRQALDRLVRDARDRVGQARDELSQALARPERLPGNARAAAIASGTAQGLIDQVLRRWRDNRFPADQIAPAGQARTVLADEVAAPLVLAGRSDRTAAQKADTGLDKAEKLLSQLLADGDLTRRLRDLVARQESLHTATRSFVNEYLPKPMDELGKARQADLARRQAQLTEDVKAVERAVLAGTAAPLAPAQELVRAEAPGENLQRATERLNEPAGRGQAVEPQATALAAMKKLLELLQGSDASSDLAKRAGELAWRQGQLTKALEDGRPPPDLAQQQDALRADTEKLAAEVERRDAEAGTTAKAATRAQAQAGAAMRGNDKSGAVRESSAAEALLRDLQKKLGPNDEKKKDGKKPGDVLALLRELEQLQSRLVTRSVLLHEKLGEREPDFAAGREIRDLAQGQSDVQLRLQEEGLKALEKNPIATASLKRVDTAMTRAGERLGQNALGARGVRLVKMVLVEIQRLIAIAENLPQTREKADGGGEGEGGQPPAFPPAAELALLAAMEDEIGQQVAAGRPGKLAEAQAAVRDLIDLLGKNSRPGSRPNLLLARAWRAAASAAQLLQDGDRGAPVRNELVAAHLHLRQILEEAKASSGGGGGGSGRPPPQQGKDDGQGEQKPAQPNPGNGEGAAAGAATAKGSTTPGTSEPGRSTAQTLDKGEFLNLTPRDRELLKEARRLGLSPRAEALYRRYLECLEEGR